MPRDQWTIQIERTRAPLARRATYARTPWARMRGLLGRRELPDGEALVFERCWSIHTVGMRFAIDAVFVDRDWRVVALRCNLGPGQLIPPIPDAWGAIELAAGSAARHGVQIGDRLEPVQVTARGQDG